VRVRYDDEESRTRVVDASGGLAELLQHEIDHLEGVLAIDRALDRTSFATRQEWQARYAGARQRSGG